MHSELQRALPLWLLFTTILLPKAPPWAGSPAANFAFLPFLPLHVQTVPKTLQACLPHLSPVFLAPPFSTQIPTASPPTSGSPQSPQPSVLPNTAYLIFPKHPFSQNTALLGHSQWLLVFMRENPDFSACFLSF